MPENTILLANDSAFCQENELIIAARHGEKMAVETIIKRYEKIVKLRARSYFLVGADYDDIVQEGFIGLYKAIRDFCPDKQVTFRAFADICITRQIITAVKTATRQKHMPLNSYVSLNKPAFDDESDKLIDDIYSLNPDSNPEALFIGKEDYSLIEGIIGETLSDLEQNVLKQHLQGKTYHDISIEIKKPIKSVDNALQRIKKKLAYALVNLKDAAG